MSRFLMVLAFMAAASAATVQADDRAVAEKIAERLRKSGQLSGYRIGVKFNDGTAWLRGQVADEAQMDQALDIASRTPHVKRVINKLEVGGAAAAPQVPAEESSAVMPASATEPQGPVLNASPNVIPRTPQQPQRMAYRGQPGYPRGVPMAMRPAGPGGPGGPGGPMQVAAMMQPGCCPPGGEGGGGPVPAYEPGVGGGPAPMAYDQPSMPGYAWPSYASYPNYAGVTYPRQYSPTAWPYIGPFYPYPQVPLGWRKVTLEWDDGWWMLDFKD
jgi:hypothetical protein